MGLNIKKDVRILFVGESGVGKTSLIYSLISEEFSEDVVPRLEEITIPPDVTPEKVPTLIVDYSERNQNNEFLENEIYKANVICIVYSVVSDLSFEKITQFWLPLIREYLGEEHNKPVILVGNKVDLLEYSSLNSMLPIMNQFSEIETCVECSAKTLKNVSEVFYYAQKAVLHPTAPLYNSDERDLTEKCKKALSRIFKLSDDDNDGILNDEELNLFQLKCFNSLLEDEALENVKNIIKRNVPNGIFDDGLTLNGFLSLQTFFIQKSKHEITWAILRKFGYNDKVDLDESYLKTNIEIPVGCSTELSQSGIDFLTKLFLKYDKDRDDALSQNELKNLFNFCPYIPSFFNQDYIQSYIQSEDKGYLKLSGFLSLWTLMTLIDVKTTLEFFAYLGYITSEQNQLSGILITRDKRVDLQKKQTNRNVFTCHLIGPQGAGKSSFMKGLLGRNLEEQAQLNFSNKTPNPNYVINTMNIYGQEKYLIIKEVDIFELTDKLNEPELYCDVVCLMYDASNPKSFEYIARIFLKHFDNCKLPILIVAAKSDELTVKQQYSIQPDEFCIKYKLPKIHSFTATDLKKDVYIKLCTMAAYPNLKKLVHVLLMRPNGSWVSNHFSSIQGAISADTSTVIKTTIGIATIAVFGIFVARIMNSEFSMTQR